MPDLFLSHWDLMTVRRLLKDHSRPDGVRRGTWHRLMTASEPAFVGPFPLDEWRAIVEAEPRVLDALGLVPSE